MASATVTEVVSASKIQIDPEFHALIPPLTPEELAQLERNLLAEGCRDPLVVWNGVLLDGHNRHAICKAHGLTYQVIERPCEDRDDAKEWIVLNQFGRRNLTAFQRGELALVLEPLIQKRAKANQGTRTDLSAKLPEGLDPIETREEIARVAGLSGRTIDKVREIRDKAPDETKARLRAGELSIDRAFKDLRDQERKIEQFSNLQTQPFIDSGQYGIIYADPPWSYSNSGFSQSAAQQYPTMETDAIAGLPVASVCADNAVLFLWVTSPILPDGLRVMFAWGFDYKASLVWVKDRAPGIGWFVKTRHEFLLIGTRGSAHPVDKQDSVIEAPVTEHSRKPDAAYDLIERMYPGVRAVELFARTARQGWDTWGNQPCA